MSNSEYWRKRFEQVTESELKKADMYQETLEKSTKKQLFRFKRISILGITALQKIIELRMQSLNDCSIAKNYKELKWTLDDYIKYGEENNINGKWVQQLKMLVRGYILVA